MTNDGLDEVDELYELDEPGGLGYGAGLKSPGFREPSKAACSGP